jgi:hypothetical protein
MAPVQGIGWDAVPGSNPVGGIASRCRGRVAAVCALGRALGRADAEQELRLDDIELLASCRSMRARTFARLARSLGRSARPLLEEDV